MPDTEQAEIIARPPSHPIATTLLVLSMFAMGLSIYFVWQELFTEYLPAGAPGKGPSESKAIAQEHRHDHYKVDKDFKGVTNLEQAVADDLGLKADERLDAPRNTGEARPADDKSAEKTGEGE